ncbi:MAG: NADH-quinone oxidoreductase subunit NuoH [Candidatus Caldipriscus sp.]|nr:NADH-quinone oxidoreductase subunit NuoH [Candidatus Caldipriscus sp.]
MTIPNYIFNPVLFLVVALLVGPILVYLERKIAARLQNRIGPYYVGRPHGWLQIVADGLKLLSKEDIVPKDADKILFNLAPLLFASAAIWAFAPIPLDEKIYIINTDWSLILVFAIASIEPITAIMAGWGSSSKYPIISSLRALGQMVSYEIPFVLGALTPAVFYGTLNIYEIIKFQEDLWFAFIPVIGQISLLLTLFGLFAETNRAPLDIAEAESELVSGFNVEYSGIKFGLFYLGEWIYLFAGSLLVSALFFGGWQGPLLPGIAWTLIKGFILFSIIVFLRWTFLRLRLDQMTFLSWKVLVPLSIFNFLLAAGYKVLIS